MSSKEKPKAVIRNRFKLLKIKESNENKAQKAYFKPSLMR